jgi:hypothetical protein
LGPAGWFDIWNSPDGMTRGNVALGLTLGRGSFTDEYDDGFFTDKDEASGTMLSFHAGLGGDHFLSPHFALGVEGGFQGTFALNLSEKGGPDDVTLSASGLYGLFRTMIVF